MEYKTESLERPRSECAGCAVQWLCAFLAIVK